MTRDEMECYQSTQADINLYWVPGLWFIQRLRDARRRGIIRDAQGVKLIMEVCYFFPHNHRIDEILAAYTPPGRFRPSAHPPRAEHFPAQCHVTATELRDFSVKLTGLLRHNLRRRSKSLFIFCWPTDPAI